MTRVRIATDGYVSAEGAAGWAFVAEGEALHHVASGAIPGDAQSHLAEWVAVTEALAWAEAHLAPGDRVDLQTDSALVAKGLASRRPEMSGEAGERRAACRQALSRLAQRDVRVKVHRVPRHLNEAADGEARKAARGEASGARGTDAGAAPGEDDAAGSP